MQSFKQFKSLAKHSLVYSIGGMASKLIGVILTPLLTNTHNLTTNEYGVYSMVETIMAIAPTILTFFIGSNAMQRFYWDKAYEGKQKTLVFNNIFILSFTSFFALILIFFLKSQISLFFFKTEAYSSIIFLSFLITFFIMLNGGAIYVLNLNQKSIKATIYSVSYLFLLCFGTWANFNIWKGGLEGIYKTQLAVCLFQFFIVLPYLYKNTEFKIKKKIIKEIIIFGIPFSISSLSFIFYGMADRYIISMFDTINNVGYYSLGYKLSNTLKVIVNASILTALLPMLYKYMHTEFGFSFHAKAFRYLSILCLWIGLAFVFARVEILHVFTSDSAYMVSSIIIPILVLGSIIGLLKDIVDVGLYIAKKTKIISLMFLFGTILSIILNLCFIKTFIYFGIYSFIGTAISSLCVQIFLFTIEYKLSKKYYHVNYQINKLLITFAVTLVLFLLYLPSTNMSLYVSIPYRILLLILYPILLYFFKVFSIEEAKNLLIAYKHIKNRIK